MKRNKIIALLLSLVLALNLGISAMAAGETFTTVTEAGDTEEHTFNHGNLNQGVKVPTLIKVPVIEVSLGIPGNIIVNPFGIKYADSGDPDRISTAEIISVPSTITNNSGTGVKLSLTPTVSVNEAGGLKVDNDGTASLSDDTKKFIQVRMATLKGEDEDSVKVAGSYTDAGTIVKETGTTPTDLILDKKGGTNPCGGYMFKGETSSTNWTTADTVTVNVVFKITAKGNSLS